MSKRLKRRKRAEHQTQKQPSEDKQEQREGRARKPRRAPGRNLSIVAAVDIAEASLDTGQPLLRPRLLHRPFSPERFHGQTVQEVG